MTRTGKIARRPQATRHELNCRLADGEVGASLLRRLNGLPAARDVFHVRNFHRGGAEALLKKCGVGGGARKRVDVSCGADRGESNLVQAKYFSGAVGRVDGKRLKIAELQARHPLTCLKTGVSETREEFCLASGRQIQPTFPLTSVGGVLIFNPLNR